MVTEYFWLLYEAAIQPVGFLVNKIICDPST
jgi:hypothetical protein